MPINDPKKAHQIITHLREPRGTVKLLLSESERDNFDRDPDGFAANYFGLTKAEYCQWIELEGTPYCSHRTKSGDLCRIPAGHIHLSAAKWKATHRRVPCGLHERK